MDKKEPPGNILMEIGGPLFLACTFAGMAIGYMAIDSIAVGLVGGMIAGFVAIAIKHKLNG
ncbi:hypothetical protein ACFLTT_00100 [Chloroflexota bacterium]